MEIIHQKIKNKEDTLIGYGWSRGNEGLKKEKGNENSWECTRQPWVAPEGKSNQL